MLVTFKTDSYASITMFGDIALTFLKMMDHSDAVPGAILAEDVPEAERLLSSAFENKSISQLMSKINSEDGDKPVVSLKNRALPLINLLKAAENSKSNVMWE